LVIGYVATGHGHFLFGEKKHPITPAGRDHQTARSLGDRAVAWPGTTIGLRPLSVPGQATHSHPDCRAGLILIVGLQETLRLWVRQAQRDQGRREGMTTDDRAQLRALERENRELLSGDMKKLIPWRNEELTPSGS
jgi:transposase